MALSEKLRQARQEAGLSQKALCADKITRNMLSQIENGLARPSMDTLQYLAKRLERPVSWFLEEEGVLSPNARLMEQAREAEPSDCLVLLEQFREPDPVLSRERWLLEALVCLRLGEKALQNRQPDYARSLLARAGAAGSRTPYYSADLEHRRLLLLWRAGDREAAQHLPSIDGELLLRADCALKEENYARCAALLESCEEKSPRWHLLRGQGLLGQKCFAEAKDHFLISETAFPGESCRFLEDCCRELGDFQGAYRYACLNRDRR